MNEKNLARLSEIEDQTGLQFSKYQSAEFVEATAEYIAFPVLVMSTALWAAAVCLSTLVGAIAGFYFATNGVWAAVLFSVLGLVITVPWVFFRFLAQLIRKIESDLMTLGALGIRTTRTAVGDVRELATRSTSISLPSARDLFEGVMLGALVPTVQTVIETKLPLFPQRIASLVSRLLCQISEAIASTIDAVQETAAKAARSAMSSLSRKQQIEETSPTQDSTRTEALDRWSVSIENGLQAAEGSHEKIVHATVGRARRIAARAEGFLVVCLAGSWTLIWLFAR